jgi:hypothetical protein
MSDPELLRLMATHLLGVAISSRDPELAERLTLRASDYLEQANELERASATAAQQAQHPQPGDPERTD